jgi:hypothetical protein
MLANSLESCSNRQSLTGRSELRSHTTASPPFLSPQNGLRILHGTPLCKPLPRAIRTLTEFGAITQHTSCGVMQSCAPSSTSRFNSIARHTAIHVCTRSPNRSLHTPSGHNGQIFAYSAFSAVTALAADHASRFTLHLLHVCTRMLHSTLSYHPRQPTPTYAQDAARGPYCPEI